MPDLFRVVAFLAGVSLLYVLGYVAMSVTPAPWGLVWLVPLAVLGGGAWTVLEWAETRSRRRSREHLDRGEPIPPALESIPRATPRAAEAPPIEPAPTEARQTQ